MNKIPKLKEELLKELADLKLENASLKVMYEQEFIKHRKMENLLRMSNDNYSDLVESSNDLLTTHDLDGNLLSVNNAAINITGYSKEEVIKKNMRDFIAPEYRRIFDAYLSKIKAIGHAQGLMIVQTKTGERRIWEYHNTLRKEGLAEPIVRGIAMDITQQKREEIERQILLEITNGITTTANLNELLKLIHHSLGKILYVENFFVALYDQITGLFSFPYFIDKFDSAPEPIAIPKSCTAYVYRTGKPLLLTSELSQKLEEQNEVELIGSPSPSLVGVPLKISNRTIGVLVLQHYEEENVYSEQDVKFLNSVGSQIALVIERKLAEDELRSSEDMFRRLFNESADPILILDETGFTNCNSATVSLLQYSSKKEFLNKKPWELSPEKQPDGLISSVKAKMMIDKAIAEGYNRFEWIHIKSDGSELPVEVMLTPIQLKGKQCLYTIWRDITERKRAELERQVIYEITRAITTTSNLDELLKIIHQCLGKVIYSENCFVSLHDPHTGLFSFPYWVDKFDPIPESAAMKKSCTAYVYRTGKPLLLTSELSQKLEEQNEVELVGTPSPSWIGMPLRTPNKTIGVLVLQHYEEENIYSERDVQFLDSVGSQIALAIERKLAEGAIKRERDFSHGALDSLPGLFYLIDNQGKFLRWNKNFEKMTGYTAEEITNLSPLSLFDDPDKTLIAKSVQETFQIGETAVEAVLVSKDKTKTSFFFTGKLFNFENKECLVGMGIDVTDRKLAEENLQKERLLLRTVIDNIPDSIYCKDTTGRKTLANVMELRFSGATTAVEILGKTDFDIYPKEIAEGFYADDQLIIQKGQLVINREEFLFDDKGQKLWLMTSKIPLKDNEGNIIGIVGIGHNITDRKNAEEEIKKRNDELSKINAEKDKFFSIIAHDLRSPLQGVMGLSEIMASEDENLSKDEFLLYSKDLNLTASNIFKLLENLLEWAQMQKGEISFTPQELDLSDYISQNIGIIYQRAVQKGIIIENEAKESEKVFADDKMLNTILRNIISNAVKFTRKGGKVIIRTKKTDSNMVEVSVSDTGVGISKKNLKKLFKLEEKLSSKGTEGESSTGLGLLLCKEFVEKSGGKIWVESEEGVGSSFYFTLPERDDAFIIIKEKNT